MNTHSKASRLYCLVTLVAMIAGSINLAKADIVVVDPVDDTSVNPSHLGVDLLLLNVIAPNVFARLHVAGGTIGVDAGGTVFTPGADLVVLTNQANADYLNTTFQAGAGTGLNYIRLDMDSNSVFETVLEVDFGVDTSTADDRITQYAYDDGFSDLNISNAVSAFTSVPEPGVLGLFALGGLFAMRRGRKVRR